MSNVLSLDTIRHRVRESIALKEALLDERLVGSLATVADMIIASAREGGKVVLFGNGGSAADATHLAAEFVGRFKFDRDPLPALSLSDNGSSVTAIGNDYAYELTFARQLKALGRPGDTAIGISTSGTSPNVVEALRTARAMDMRTVSFTGARGFKMAALSDVSIMIPTQDTARVQEGYMLYAHIMCELVEQAIFGATRLQQAA
ncbi:SIS domain-containing protein [Solirubrobacter sp. CPCC 204708]|uniref:Phosphoheptose isomerase n=1 Tax=Solirubrobacter deserti TaxID=2282478 RepID=A0ABT4RM61_9ACTN|nr:SIS domain-containing protein [Solirubrobacter deserti]MBE2320423.1 SIS domain-containing protein [Solirubrobacter deserti]MDA0139386.1 SIS domain-containing protein [Solirubrobacter deserti]